VLVFLHHHLESGHENSPWNDSSAELVQNSGIKILNSDFFFPRFFNVPLIKRERLLSGFRLSNTCLLVFNLPLLLFLKDFLIKGLFRSFWNIVGFEGYFALRFFPQLALSFILFQSLLTDSFFVLLL